MCPSVLLSVAGLVCRGCDTPCGRATSPKTPVPPRVPASPCGSSARDPRPRPPDPYTAPDSPRTRGRAAQHVRLPRLCSVVSPRRRTWPVTVPGLRPWASGTRRAGRRLTPQAAPARPHAALARTQQNEGLRSFVFPQNDSERGECRTPTPLARCYRRGTARCQTGRPAVLCLSSPHRSPTVRDIAASVQIGHL